MDSLPLSSMPNPFMAVPNPQEKVPQLQRETASIQPEQVDPQSARNLLRKVFSRKWEPLPTAQKLQNDHLAFLLDTPVGRDFNLITAAGVEFKVHSMMLIGGSKFIQEGLFPGGATPPVPVTFVNLPPHWHPILVDRIVNFIYTSDYTFTSSSTDRQREKSNFKFYNATLIPDVNPPTPATIALIGVKDYTFHLHMYALGEELDYDALKITAHAKLYTHLVQRHNYTPSAVKDVIEATFAPPGDAARVCKDDDLVLQQLAVASVLAHEGKIWTEAQRKEFTDSIQAPAYAPFRIAYDVIKEENKDLLAPNAIGKTLADKRKKAAGQRQRARDRYAVRGESMSVGTGNKQLPPGNVLRKQKSPTKFKRRPEDKRAAATPELGGDEDMDMEVD